MKSNWCRMRRCTNILGTDTVLPSSTKRYPMSINIFFWNERNKANYTVRPPISLPKTSKRCSVSLNTHIMCNPHETIADININFGQLFHVIKMKYAKRFPFHLSSHSDHSVATMQFAAWIVGATMVHSNLKWILEFMPAEFLIYPAKNKLQSM